MVLSLSMVLNFLCNLQELKEMLFILHTKKFSLSHSKDHIVTFLEICLDTLI